MARSTKDEVKVLMKGLDLLYIKYIHIWVNNQFLENDTYEECLEMLPSHMKEDGWLVLESRKERILPPETKELVKIKEKTYGISKLTYYRRKEI